MILSSLIHSPPIEWPPTLPQNSKEVASVVALLASTAGAGSLASALGAQPNGRASRSPVPPVRRSRSSSCDAGLVNARTHFCNHLQDFTDLEMNANLLHPGWPVLHRPRRHDGASVFAHLRDLLSRAVAPEETSHITAGRLASHQSSHHHLTSAHARSLVAGLAARTRSRVFGRSAVMLRKIACATF